MGDAFDRASASVLEEHAAGAPGEPDAGAPPAEEPQPAKRGRGRPPKHGRYSQKGKTAPPPPETPPAAPAPQFSPEQLAHSVRGLLVRISESTQTQPPHDSEAEALGTSLAYGLERTTVGLEQSGPWTPFLMASALYALPRVMEFGLRELDRRRAARDADLEAEQEASAPATFRQVAAAVAPPTPEPGASSDADGVDPVGLRAVR